MAIMKDMDELGSLFGPRRLELASEVASRASLRSRASEDRDAAWKKSIRMIHGMLALNDDWDGMGAKAPSSALIFYAMEMAEAKLRTCDYPAPTRVTATPAGTIGLEWQQGSTYTEAEIVAPYKSEWMQIAPGMPVKHWVESGERAYGAPTHRVDATTCGTTDELQEVFGPKQDFPPVYWGRDRHVA